MATVHCRVDPNMKLLYVLKTKQKCNLAEPFVNVNQSSLSEKFEHENFDQEGEEKKKKKQ